MSRYPGEVTPGIWAAHADAGRVTWSAGTPWQAADRIPGKGPAMAFAAGSNIPLFRWEGRTGHQAEIPGNETEPEIG